MIVKDIVEFDSVNYRKLSMFIICPYCTFKCGRDCQNIGLASECSYAVSDEEIIDRYLSTPFTNAIVFGGLEPLDSIVELYQLIKKFREKTDDDIVIYTGYTENELEENLLSNDIKRYWTELKKMTNLVVKFGRYIKDNEKHYDEILGVELASTNQYAKRYNYDN